LKDQKLTYLILVCYTVYGLLFIYNTSFVINGERYFSLIDDAMVSMRYGRNFSEGYGLVWNPNGERVEGYTDPLWVIWMALLHLLHLPQSKISVLVQFTSLIALIVNLFYVRKITALIFGNDSAASYAAMIFTATYLPLNNWSLQGLEVGACTLAVTLAIWIALKSLEQKRFNVRLYILLGIATLLRIDFIIPAAMITLYLLITDKQFRWKHLTTSIAVISGFMLFQTTLRYWYYREFLPNTYYQKMTGYPVDLRIIRGAIVYWQYFLYPHRWLLLFVGLFVTLTKKRRYVLVLIMMLIGQSLYSIFVGGDVWEFWGGTNRYVTPAMPGFLILLSLAIVTVFRNLSDSLPIVVRSTSLITLIVASIYLLNDIGIEKGDGIKEMMLLKKPDSIHYNEGIVKEALYLRSITTSEAKIAIVWAGSFSYFTNRNMVDLLGKNDKVIARQQWNKSFPGFLPGHVKWDYAYSIGKLKPDIVAQTWYGTEAAHRFLDTDYTLFMHNEFTHYLRKNSSAVLIQHNPHLAGE
jgi:hypothetical protein